MTETPLTLAQLATAITPPIDGLGGALGQYIDVDGRLVSQSGGLGILAVILLVMAGAVAGAASARAACAR
jgi:hypothetical protein